MYPGIVFAAFSKIISLRTAFFNRRFVIANNGSTALLGNCDGDTCESCSRVIARVVSSNNEGGRLGGAARSHPCPNPKRSSDDRGRLFIFT